MKVIFERVEDDNYLEISLTSIEMDYLDMNQVMTKEINIGKKKLNVSVLKLKREEEDYATEEG